ncbi:uncharacterized protein EDB93DRAFT_1338123 [Suillus bovinus]|uniref:uncharacterized protein n=1 Tax=Suillus bovinus TaxID=48563 RepID=UPI001B8628EB|nr:uncharacterized protein EDB93DRAFT_1338123 [Suillus bovinus]KAG2143762.1 hypothetical protein EDB93DRAFT_1338123 [Suillus bovinus]
MPAMFPSIIDPVARNIAIITSTCTVLMVLEYFWFVKDEVRLVWPRFLKTTEAKFYMVTRYAGLAGQGFNNWFAFRMVSGVLNSPSTCRAWYLYQTITTQYLLFSVELSLMLRVYKMYHKDKSICALLIIFGGTQFAAMAANARLMITGTRYFPTCVIISPHNSRIYVGTSGWSETPRAWVRLAVRDCTCTAIAITTILIFMFLCITRIVKTQMSGNIIFYVLFSCLWFAAGRIVLHQEKFRHTQDIQKAVLPDPSRWTQTVEVDPDDITPFDDLDACPTSPSDLKAESFEVSTSFDSMSGMGDIADELCEDNIPLSNCIPAFMLIERCSSNLGYVSEEVIRYIPLFDQIQTTTAGTRVDYLLSRENLTCLGPDVVSIHDSSFRFNPTRPSLPTSQPLHPPLQLSFR